MSLELRSLGRGDAKLGLPMRRHSRKSCVPAAWEDWQMESAAKAGFGSLLLLRTKECCGDGNRSRKQTEVAGPSPSDSIFLIFTPIERI